MHTSSIRRGKRTNFQSQDEDLKSATRGAQRNESNQIRGVLDRQLRLLGSTESGVPPSSPEWLGALCDRERVRGSGLWNNNRVDEAYDLSFLTVLARYVERMGPGFTVIGKH
jgi:hypothetical protein